MLFQRQQVWFNQVSFTPAEEEDLKNVYSKLFFALCVKGLFDFHLYIREVNVLASEKVLNQKKQAVADLVEKFKAGAAGVLVDYKGITVADDTKLRAELREAGIYYSVIKNSIIRFAAREAGLDELTNVLEGTTAIAIANDDALEVSRIIAKYADAQKEGFNIKGGFMDGAVIDASIVDALAKIPPREVLIAQMLSSLNAPISKFAVVLDQIAQKTA